jgi:replicative DNA helicase
LTSAVDKIERLYRNKDPITGIPTGYTDLDKLTAGLQDSDLIIVAARPSMGKTALALNFAEHAVMNADADDGVVLFFSMEQPAEQLIMRLLSSLGHIDQTRMRTGELGDDDWPRFSSAVSQLKDKKLFIDDTAALTPNDIRTRARRVSREMGGLKMILVDYLQLMRSATAYDNRATEISEISRSLKAIAKEMKCPVVALSQLNRSLENRPDKRPHMSDLRESGAIEQDADVIFFIYRDEVYNEDSQDKGLAEIIIGKQRNGPIGSVKLTFIGNLTKFENYTPSDRYEELMN